MTTQTSWEELPPAAVPNWLERHPGACLIDVREPHELLTSAFAGAKNLPLSQVATWIGTLAPGDPILFICQSGVRSQHICAALANQGFARLANLTGGMKAWVRRP